MSMLLWLIIACYLKIYLLAEQRLYKFLYSDDTLIGFCLVGNWHKEAFNKFEEEEDDGC